MEAARAQNEECMHACMQDHRCMINPQSSPESALVGDISSHAKCKGEGKLSGFLLRGWEGVSPIHF